MKKLFSMIAAVLFAGSMFAETATIKYPGGTTTNMVGEGTNNAETVGLDATEFEVLADKGGNQNFPGLNTAGDIRLYANKNDGNGNIITVKLIPAGKIDSIKLDISQTATFVVKAGETAVAEAEGKYVIDGQSFSIQNTTTGATTQLRLKSITIYYTLEAVADPTIKVKNSLDFGTVYVMEGQKASIDLTLDVEGLNLTEAIEYSCVEPTTTITGTLTKDGGTLAIHIEAAAGTYSSAIHFTSDLGGGATVANETVIKGEVKEVAQYDVAEAIAAGLSKDDVIVLRGVVTNMAAKGSNFATYGSLKIYVKDATGAAGEFQLFNCMSLENAKFTTTTPAYDAASTQWADFTSVTDANGNKLSVGDTVFAFGKYELYNSTYELQQGCYLLEIKEGQAPQPEVIEMTYTTTDGLQWTDATADQGWWQIILGGVLSLSNAGTVASPAGTYAAADLDASYSYVVSGSTKVTFTEGSITVAVDENEVVTIKGQLVGTDGNTYKFDLTFDPDEYVVDPYSYDENQDFTATFSSYTVEEESDGVFSIMAISDGKGVALTAFLPTGATAEQAAGKTFPINDSGDEQTVAAGYYDGTDGVMPSYAALINASYQITNVWYLVSGTATVDANLNITVAAKNSKGRNINIKLNYPSTGIQDVKTVEKLVKYIQNGQIMINVNGAQYNVNGARVK